MDNFIQTLSAAMGLYNRGLSKAEATLWVSMMMCEGIDSRTAIGALQTHLGNPDKGQYAPKPSDLIGIVKGTTRDIEARAMEAWELAILGVRKAGSYRDVVFDDPIIHSTIALLGGWLTFCMMETDQMPFIRKDFIKTYAVASQRSNHPNILRGKAGWDDVMFIGDQTKCKALFDRTGVQPQQLPTINVKTLSSE